VRAEKLHDFDDAADESREEIDAIPQVESEEIMNLGD
jgi:hypothetical protein